MKNWAVFATILSGSMFAQSTPPAFEIADVHPSAPGATPRMSGGVAAGQRYAIRNASMLDLIRTAYGVTDRTMLGADDNSRIVGGPNWLDLDRFDIIAKVPRSTQPETLKLMLRTLLAERFQLVVHADTRPLPGWVLSMGKGKPKMKESTGSGDSGCKAQVQFEYVCRNITMEQFAQGLRGMGYRINSDVINRTGLQGSWDFDLRWAGENRSVFEAIDQQLGLKLELQKIPTPVFVVDSTNRKPTDNAPDVTSRLPPLVTKFDVATIKLSMPGAQTRRRIQPGGQLDIQANTLRMLINLAWNINNDEMLIGAPKFVDAARFDILARASTDSAKASLPVDLDDFRPMLRALLEERFMLVTHTEDRPVNAYKLVASKPKLQKADPSNRTGCKEGPGADGKDPRVGAPWLARLLTCQNVTLAQFAELLPNWAGDYINTSVVNATGIEGEVDLTLNFSPRGLLQQLNQQEQAGGADPNPNRPLSIFDGLADQLGLKLQTEKRVIPVLVIDRIQENPTDN